MIYDGTIRIQSSINVNHLQGILKSTDYIKIQSRANELAKVANNLIKEIALIYKPPTITPLSNLVSLLQSSIDKSFRQKVTNMSAVMTSYHSILGEMNLHIVKSFQLFGELSDKCLFLEIADEMGFPIYLEVDSELQDKLIYSYKENGQCNKKEMREIILDYYNDEIIDHILNGIRNVQVFNSGRVVLIEEGIKTYKLGLYGSSASLFATQLSGMIRDVYKELSTFHRLTNKEKRELLIDYDQNCKPESEKGMLIQIVDSQQSQGFMIWYKILRHFFNIVYSTNECSMSAQPQRHMICHGKQTNYNTKEMNLKLILCMDIIAELAWRVKNMKDEYLEAIIDV